MKQPEDSRTHELNLDPPRPVGRPAKYASQAERQAAYRERKAMRSITIAISPEVHAKVMRYMTRQEADGAALTLSQVVEKLLEQQLLRKR